ncbi:MAG: phosphate ABC transporter permease PstA [Fimbriimonadales bacterium]
MSQLASRSSGRRRLRKATNFVALSLTGIGTLFAIGAFLLVIGYLVVGGIRALHWGTLVEGATPMGSGGGGLRNAIVGTLILILVASCIGVPIGILGGVYQVESKNRFAGTVRFLADVLNSIPSIVIGLFVYSVVVIPIAQRHQGQGFSALAGGIAMSIIMIPIVMSTTEEILRMVPNSIREASLALGASRCRTMWRVLLPAARGGLITGVMLAVARVAGETAPLLFTAFGNVTFNIRLDKAIDALPLSIFYNATSPYDYLHQQAMAGSILLIGLIFLLSLVTRFALRSPTLAES